MNLSDHLRPLLRDHDCVIIPDFGGLVAEYTSARVQPGGRHVLSPPTRQVAFNQALTRNDGLLVDALREHLGLPAAEAREALRQAVALLNQELQAQQRTELPGIGVFRQLAGRGLQFEYTGTDNMLAASFGLPELTAHPIRATDARLSREQQVQLVPRLRATGRGLRLRRLVPGAAIGLLAGLAVASLYLLNLHPEAVPVAWRGYVPQWSQSLSQATPQRAALHPVFVSPATVLVDSLATTAPATGTVAPDTAGFPVVAAPDQTAPAHPAAAQADPVDALLAPKPTPAKQGKKVPAAGMAAIADESNVARPVPIAKRPPGSPAAKAYVPPSAVAHTPPLAPAKAAEVAVAEPKAKPAAPAAPVTTIKTRTGRYYLIVAAYASLKGAEQGRRNLAHAGRPAKIILPPAGSRLYRLSAADYPDRATANAAAARLRQSPHIDKSLSVLAY